MSNHELSAGHELSANCRVIVIGASAGGIEALVKLVGDLPASLSAPVLVVVHVPPTHHHLTLEGGVMRLFRSAAREYGPRVAGVVLSGMLYDGTGGLITIKRQGGTAIVQDPNEALFSGMPRSAIESDHPDYVLPLSQIAATLMRLAQDHSPKKDAEKNAEKRETDAGANILYTN